MPCFRHVLHIFLRFSVKYTEVRHSLCESAVSSGCILQRYVGSVPCFSIPSFNIFVPLGRCMHFWCNLYGLFLLLPKHRFQAQLYSMCDWQ